MPEKKTVRGGDPRGETLDAALREYYGGLKSKIGASMPAPPLGRLPPRASAVIPDRYPASIWRRAILSNLGFAACFLVLTSIGLFFASANPSPFARRLSESYRNGDFARNAEYIGRQLNAALEYSIQDRTSPTGHKEIP